MQHLGHEGMHDLLMAAMEAVLRDAKYLTRDMGGKSQSKRARRGCRSDYRLRRIASCVCNTLAPA